MRAFSLFWPRIFAYSINNCNNIYISIISFILDFLFETGAARHGQKIFASIPELSFTARGEKGKEVYVLSFATHANKLAMKEAGQNIRAANNEHIPDLVPSDFQDSDLLDQVLVSASNIFDSVSADYPVSLSGDGIVLYPPMDPGELFGLNFFVIESDSGARGIAKTIEAIAQDSDVNKALNLAKGLSGAAPVGTVLKAVFKTTMKLLKKNKDDIYLSHGHSGLPFNNYGIGAGQASADFELKNKYVNCILRLQSLD